MSWFKRRPRGPEFYERTIDHLQEIVRLDGHAIRNLSSNVEAYESDLRHHLDLIEALLPWAELGANFILDYTKDEELQHRAEQVLEALVSGDLEGLL